MANDAPLESSLTLQGISLQIHAQGRGPTLLYLHPGDGLSKSMALMRCLAQDFRVIAPSPPGFDGSGPPHAYRTVDDLSYLLLDVMDELGLQDVVLVGVSFGAWLAAEIAVKGQERISKVVLINPVGIKFGKADNEDIADIFYHSHRDVRRLLYADGKPDDNDYGPVSSDVVATMVRNRESLTWFAWSPLLNNPRLRSRLHRIRVPTLLLRGSNDRVVTERYTKSYADAISGARPEFVQDAGHYVHDERPEELAKRITSFVREESKSASGLAPRSVKEARS
jgi:pimeloyl-ACP methyl ester carboxylesterase